MHEHPHVTDPVFGVERNGINVGGTSAGTSVSLYSWGLTLLTLWLRLPRYKTVLIDGVLILLSAVYVLFIANNFLAPFESFLQLLADGLTAWAAVFLVDMLRHRGYDAASLENSGPTGRYFYWRGVSVSAVGAWLAGLLVSLLFTASPLFTGPFATGLFATSSLGYLLGFLVSAGFYAIFNRLGFVERVRKMQETVQSSQQPVLQEERRS